MESVSFIITEAEDVDWISMSRHRDQWQIIMNPAMNLGVRKRALNFD
jgi:hypothetical protein